MKLYMEKGEYTPISIMLVTILLFLGLPAASSVPLFNLLIGTGNVTLFIFRLWTVYAIPMVIFMFGWFLVYETFRPPTAYVARLSEKSIGTCGEKKVTVLEFVVPTRNKKGEPDNPATYRCYVFGECNLEKEKLYVLYVNRFTGRARRVEELTDEEIIEPGQKNENLQKAGQLGGKRSRKVKIAKSRAAMLKPVLVVMLIFTGTELALILTDMYINAENWPMDIIALVFFSLLSSCILGGFYKFKQKDDKNEK